MENNFAKHITGLQHIGLPTNDLEETVAFYEMLGFQVAFRTVNEAAGERMAPFWENGVKFFTVVGPNKEKVEFSQYL